MKHKKTGATCSKWIPPLENLGGLPEENTHCAFLASNTLKEALTNVTAQVQRSGVHACPPRLYRDRLGSKLDR